MLPGKARDFAEPPGEQFILADVQRMLGGSVDAALLGDLMERTVKTCGFGHLLQLASNTATACCLWVGTSHCPDTQLQSETEGHHERDAAVQRSSALLKHSGGSIGAAPSTSPQLLRTVSGPAPSSSSPSVVKGWCGLHQRFRSSL